MRRLPALVLVVAALTAACSGGAGGGASLSTPASGGPRLGGRLVSATPVAPPTPAPAGARAWRVSHTSEGLDGEEVVVTGEVFAPAAPAPDGGYPVVSWAHGTTGGADACTPSARRYPPAWLPELLAEGWVVAATDYPGLGTPGPHPYLVGQSEGRSVLDAAEAARAIDGLAVDDTVVVWGHSQGGHAALFAGELAASYAPALELAGVAVAAPAAELADLLSDVERSPFGLGFLVTAVVGYADVYPELDPAEVLTPQAVADLGVVEAGCIEEVVASFLRPVGEVVARSPAEVPAWAARLEENTPGRRPAGAPLLVLQGGRDSLTTQAMTDQLVERLCANGEDVAYRRYPRADHGSVLSAGRAAGVSWVADRLEGRPAPSDCGG